MYWRLVEGVREEMMALRRGFEQVINPNVLKIFACEEMEELFCGCSESSFENDRIWSKSALQQALRPDHGYTHESPQILWLVEMIHSFSLQDVRFMFLFKLNSNDIILASKVPSVLHWLSSTSRWRVQKSESSIDSRSKNCIVW